jgi:hypothetical protein
MTAAHKRFSQGKMSLGFMVCWISPREKLSADQVALDHVRFTDENATRELCLKSPKG